MSVARVSGASVHQLIGQRAGQPTQSAIGPLCEDPNGRVRGVVSGTRCQDGLS